MHELTHLQNAVNPCLLGFFWRSYFTSTTQLILYCQYSEQGCSHPVKCIYSN